MSNQIVTTQKSIHIKEERMRYLHCPTCFRKIHELEKISACSKCDRQFIQSEWELSWEWRSSTEERIESEKERKERWHREYVDSIHEEENRLGWASY